MTEPEIFKEISIGGLAKERLIQRLVDAGIQFNQYAHVLFKHRSFFPEHPVEKVKLVKLKLSDLRLSNPCSLEDIIDRSSAMGLRLCPLYLGAFLRLEYLDQPEGQYLTIVSPRPEVDENFPAGFYVRNFEGSLWLRGYRLMGTAELPQDHEFIFLK